MKNSIVLCFAFLLLSASVLLSQDTKGLQLISRNYKDSVVLRWAPTSALQWSRLNRFGYRVERVVLEKERKTKSEFQQLNSDSLKPWPVEVWKQKFLPEHPFAPIAVQAVHGKVFAASSFQSEVGSIKAKSQEIELRHSFSLFAADMDARVADGLALRWVDTSVPSDKRVLYRIIALDPDFPDTALVGINRSEIDAPVPIPDLPQADEGDKQIKLRWNTFPETPYFTAWWVEKSIDGKSWKKASSHPLVKADPPGALYPEPYLYYTDTTLSKNYVPVFYRLRGITPFGETSEPSAQLVAMGRDKTAPPSPEMGNPKDVNGKIQIAWKYPDAPSDLEGFLVAKSGAINGPFEMVTKQPLPPSTRSWTDSNPEVLGENYYVVYARDTAGNLAASMPAYGFLIDSIPPGKPTKPAGSIDTNGVVRLHWKLGPEKDIMGYRVYFANAVDHEFSNLTPKPVLDTAFTDTITLNTLTKKIYYKIAAVDRNYNHSFVSEILMLQKPDKIPPVEPLFANYVVSDTAVVLEMIGSSSKDVKQHQLFRRKAGEETWNEIKLWKGKVLPKSYSDKSIEGATYYQYALMATDSSGNKSPYSPTMDVRVMPKVSKQELKGLSLKYDKEKKDVVLAWSKPSTVVKHYVVYRGKSGNRPAVLTSPNGDVIQYRDGMLVGKGSYTYLIKAIYADGGESPLMNMGNVVVE